MSHFERVDKQFADLRYMRRPKAEFMRDFIAKHSVKDVLEIGFYHGKSSAYFAAILEDRGEGHLTTIDVKGSMALSPNIVSVLEAAKLSHRVTPVFASRSYTWELAKMIGSSPRPMFDLCYFDGGHTWDNTGYGFTLVDMVLRPGGWIIFDDMNWTIDDSIRKGDEGRLARYSAYSDDEKSDKAVRRVFNTLVPHFGYVNRYEAKQHGWGIAQKPKRSSLKARLKAVFSGGTA